MITSINAKKAFNKIQYLLLIFKSEKKTVNGREINEYFLNMVKYMYLITKVSIFLK